MAPYKKTELLSPGAVQIQDERIRQRIVHGRKPEHDDLHVHGELAIAAIAYALPDTPTGGYLIEDFDPVDLYPWGDIPDSLEEANPIRKLVIAGALIAAEIDRLQREAQRELTAVQA